ncbi:DUF624 domain-containing protein [Bifidobacterium sp. 82T10]|uniref:DUF624 domain-containing protein n=1 Tax=Bifidobacterium miconis TaxID=2834435 RepID=A0ABS6WHJ0_9BIFI|nr:DUF624 domain-containing protein [Bifidobacterium miconis]MBW3093220.1 DUF624 domain-containing protein [Bifidobacterium miconis]
MNRFAVGYEYICRIIMMVLVAHIAFIVHTVLGLGVVGFFPSIAALHTTYRTWLLDVADRSWTVKQTWTVFHRAWKAELKGANLFGYPQFALWALLIWEYYLTNWNDFGPIGYGLSGALLVINIFYGLFVMVSWVLRSNFDEKPIWIVKASLQMVVARPLNSLMTVILFLVMVWAYYTWPGLAAAFGLSVPAFIAMMVAYSYARLPGMDVHVIEPLEDRQRRRAERKAEDQRRAEERRATREQAGKKR